MSYLQDWNDLAANQTDASFKEFWDDYAGAEARIYTDILSAYADANKLALSGTFKELTDKYETTPAIFMGFLDGVNTSLIAPLSDLENITDDSSIDIEIDAEKLCFNMYAAEAKHLYALEAWDGVLSEERREEIKNDYRRSRTVRKEKTPGRNGPCPCGSGKKYKKCCGMK
jgi:hypothetical protein